MGLYCLWMYFIGMISSFSSLGGTVKAKYVAPVITGTDHYYTFDSADYSALTHKNQATGSYDLTISGSGIIDTTTNITGTADLSMNGANTEYASISSVVTGISGITIAFWFRSISNASSARVFDFGNGATNNNIEMYFDSGTGYPILSIYNGSTQYTYIGTNFININMWSDNTFRHIGITMDPNGTFKYYLNGGLHRTTTGNQYPNAVTRTINRIGIGSNYSTYSIKGGISEFRIYNGVKTDADILSYYKSNTRIDNYANMFCHYKFLTTDLTNNGNIPLLYNYATGSYDMGFNRTTLTTTSTPSANDVGLATLDNKFGSSYLYSYGPGTSASTYGAVLPSVTLPSSSGFTVCFWFKVINYSASTWWVLFNMNTSNNPAAAGQTTRYGVHGNAGGTAEMKTAGFNNTVNSFSPAQGSSQISNTWHFYHIKSQYGLSSVYHYIDFNLASSTASQTYTSAITFPYVRLLITAANDTPAYAQIDDFRFYNKLLTNTEIAAIYTKTNKL